MLISFQVWKCLNDGRYFMVKPKKKESISGIVTNNESMPIDLQQEPLELIALIVQ